MDSCRLQAAEFLYETSLFPELEYTFKHALTHEVAYGSLLQERRHVLHVRIVEAIERLYPDRLGEQVELLAHHAARGELWEKAVDLPPSSRQESRNPLCYSRGDRILRAGVEASNIFPKVARRLRRQLTSVSTWSRFDCHEGALGH